MDVREMKPGKELDVLVAEKVMGWEYKHDGKKGLMAWFGDGVFKGNCFNPSTDISAAWKVVEKMNCPYIIASTEDGESWVHFGNEGNAAIGETPHAICIAALLTLEDKV